MNGFLGSYGADSVRVWDFGRIVRLSPTANALTLHLKDKDGDRCHSYVREGGG